MSQNSRLTYFGNDPDFISEFERFLSDLDQPGELKSYSGIKGALIRTCGEDKPGAILIDITESTSHREILEEVIFIKRNNSYRGILFVALFPDLVSLEHAKPYLTSGFNLFFVKGCESESLFRDCLYIAYDITGTFPAFAKAWKIDHAVMVQAHSTVRAICGNNFVLETDLELSLEEVQVTLPFFPDLKAKSFVIKQPMESWAFFPMLHSYLIDFPLATAWGSDDSELTLQPDTLETWNSLHQDILGPEPLVIIVITDNDSLFGGIFDTVDQKHLKIYFYRNLGDEVLPEADLIFYDIAISAEEDGGLENLGDLTRSVSAQTQKPIIISTKNPSTTQATQKLLQYLTIVCAPGPLTASTLNTMTSNYFLKKKGDLLESYLFPVDSPERVVEITNQVFITTLTEHEITFYSPDELPMYSLLQFQLPFKFTVIIVPSLVKLPIKAESTHYMGFVTGVDEKNLETLRKFINSIINQPLPDYGVEAMEAYLKTFDPPVVKEVVHTPPPEAQKEKEEEVSEVRTLRRTFKGNSKL